MRKQDYQIEIRGQLDDSWSHWFDGFSMEATPQGTTIIRGNVADQSALHGLLAKIRDLNLTLLSVCCCGRHVSKNKPQNKPPDTPFGA